MPLLAPVISMLLISDKLMRGLKISFCIDRRKFLGIVFYFCRPKDGWIMTIIVLIQFTAVDAVLHFDQTRCNAPVHANTDHPVEQLFTRYYNPFQIWFTDRRTQDLRNFVTGDLFAGDIAKCSAFERPRDFFGGHGCDISGSNPGFFGVASI